jgi:BioD-like phosphotransacetylase family protein
MAPKQVENNRTRRRPGNLVLEEGRPLLETPENHVTPRIFVAATHQNEGKTTTCLGLYHVLSTMFPHVGYIKPIGQRFVEVGGMMIDEDSVLFDSVYDTDVPIEAMSPIAIDPTFTRRYLTDPKQRSYLVDRMCRAFDRAAYAKDAIIIEGSGHAGVGSICDLSNAQVARILGSKAIIVSSGGIGRPVDEIALNKSLFDKFGVEVAGAILNKVMPDKMDVVRDFAGRGLARMGVPLLAVIPEEKRLRAPNFGQVVEEVGGRWLHGEEGGKLQRIEQVIIGAMSAKDIIEHLQPGILLLCPGDRDDAILAAIAATSISGQQAAAGIMLTHGLMPHPKLMDLINRTDLPVAICDPDSYKAASRIYSMTVKTQPQDTDKIPIIRDLVMQSVDKDVLTAALKR